MIISLDFINGLVLGLEHIVGEEEDDVHWMILVNLLLVRFCFMKFKPE